MREHYFTIELVGAMRGVPTFVGDAGLVGEHYARRWNDLAEAYAVADSLRDILDFQSNVIAYDAETCERSNVVPDGITHRIRNH